MAILSTTVAVGDYGTAAWANNLRTDAITHTHDGTDTPVVAMLNAKYITAQIAATTVKNIIGIDASDVLQIGASGMTCNIVPNVTFAGAVTFTGTLAITDSSATAFTVAKTGTNYTLQVDTSTGSAATGLKIKGAAAAGGLAVSVITSGTNENLTIDAAGSGTITLGAVSTGGITLTRAVTMSSTASLTGLTFTTSVASATALATPSAYSATQSTHFASTVSGAVTMGYGTTNDVTLMNRAGTVVLGVTANTTGVVLAGALAIGGALSGVTTLATSGAINSQTISATAAFTGTVTVATGLTVSAGGADITKAGISSVNNSGSAGTGRSILAFNIAGTTKFYLGTVTASDIFAIYDAANSNANFRVADAGDGSFRANLAVGATYSSGNGIFVQNASTNNAISTGSQGAASTALYIGNGAITVVSDVRLKRDIVPTTIDALGTIARLKVVDYTWDDPSDTAPVNRNSRGRWVGMLAQDMIDVVPWIVNAEDRTCARCRAGLACPQHTSMWQVDLDHMAGLFVKGIQELTERIAALEGAR